MEITIIVPTPQYLKQAGPRIRYMRIRDLFAEAGHSLLLRPIDEYAAALKDFPSDIYIFSKCNDARAVVLAVVFKKAGKIVGIDVFDDYFSQHNNSNLVHLRQWLRSMSRFTDLVIASTPGILDVVKPYLSPKCASHILSDPFEKIDLTTLPGLIDRKIKRAQQRREIRVCWFGMGDNPHFAVGIDDLFAYSEVLAELSADGHRVHLRVLTNMRALGPGNLEKLARLPVPCEIDEWSDSRERALIADSLVSFLPVNAQTFSTVKSLNRGITTLVHGAQILSAGFPLYEPLSPFVYRTAENFLKDLRNGTLALRDETMPQLKKTLLEQADPRGETGKLYRFFSGRIRHHARKRDPTEGIGRGGAFFALLHGYETIGGAHKMASRYGLFSVASPFTTAPLRFHGAVSIPDPGVVEISMGARLRHKLDVSLKSQLVPPAESGTEEWRLRLSNAEMADLPQVLPHSKAAADLSLYRVVMNAVERIMMIVFPKIQILTSERKSPLWSAVTPLGRRAG